MSDLIDRQNAINAMMALKQEDDERYGCEIPEGFDGKRAVEALEKLPSAEPEQKWIPVTEELPKPWQEVLTTYEYKGKRFVQTAEYAGQNDENGHPLFCAYSDEFAPDHYDFVYVAWMPLPEVWRGDR